MERRRTSEFAVASLVMGIVSFVQIMNLEKAIVAIVFAVLAFKRLRSDPTLQGKRLAVAGVTLGIISFVATSILTVIYFPKIKQMAAQMQQIERQH